MANILVVDDYRDTAESMAMWLKQFGHNVQIACDGYEAIAAARKHRPDFVLLDIGLPRLDGYQVASTLRRELAGPLVIIAVTGHGYENDRKKALAAGCDHHFLKPVDYDALVSLLSATNGKPHSPVQDEPLSGKTSQQERSPSTTTRQVEITNTLGLHLRAADMFVRLARQFQADIHVAYGDNTASGRSILDLIMLAAESGTRLELRADGSDAEAALDALASLISRRFDEQSEATLPTPPAAERKSQGGQNGTRGDGRKL